MLVFYLKPSTEAGGLPRSVQHRDQLRSAFQMKTADLGHLPASVRFVSCIALLGGPQLLAHLRVKIRHLLIQAPKDLHVEDSTDVDLMLVLAHVPEMAAPRPQSSHNCHVGYDCGFKGLP